MARDLSLPAVEPSAAGGRRRLEPGRADTRYRELLVDLARQPADADGADPTPALESSDAAEEERVVGIEACELGR